MDGKHFIEVSFSNTILKSSGLYADFDKFGIISLLKYNEALELKGNFGKS